MRRLSEIARQILAGNVNHLMHAIAPLEAAGHVIDLPVKSNECRLIPLTVVSGQFFLPEPSHPHRLDSTGKFGGTGGLAFAGAPSPDAVLLEKLGHKRRGVT